MASDDEKIRLAWKQESNVQIYSNSRDQWFKGEVTTIFHDDEGEWLEVRYDKSMSKQVQRYSSDIRPIPQDPPKIKPKKESSEMKEINNDRVTNSDIEKQQKIRSEWNKGSKVEIFSNTHQEWHTGEVVDITKDEEGEWLIVVWHRESGESMSKQVQRYSTDVRPPQDPKININQNQKINNYSLNKSLSEQIQNRKKNFRRTAPPFSRTLQPSTFTYPATISIRRSRKLRDVIESQNEDDLKIMDMPKSNDNQKNINSWKFSDIQKFLRNLGLKYEKYKIQFRGWKGFQFKKITEKDLEKKNIPKLHRLKILIEISKYSDNALINTLLEDAKNIDILNWDTKKVCKFIANLKKPFNKYSKNFMDNGVDGLLLMELDTEDLKILGISKNHRPNILENIKTLKSEFFPHDPTLVVGNEKYEKKEENENDINSNLKKKRRGSTMIINQNFDPPEKTKLIMTMAKLLVELGDLFDLEDITAVTDDLKIRLNKLTNNKNFKTRNEFNHEHEDAQESKYESNDLFASMKAINIPNENLNMKNKEFDAKTNKVGFAQSWLATLNNEKGHRRRNSETISQKFENE